MKEKRRYFFPGNPNHDVIPDHGEQWTDEELEEQALAAAEQFEKIAHSDEFTPNSCKRALQHALDIIDCACEMLRGKKE